MKRNGFLENASVMQPYSMGRSFQNAKTKAPAKKLELFERYLSLWLHPDTEIEYNAIGSGAGIREITAGVYDFGASDGPMHDAELKEYRAKRGMAILHFPSITSGLIWKTLCPLSLMWDRLSRAFSGVMPGPLKISIILLQTRTPELFGTRTSSVYT